MSFAFVVIGIIVLIVGIVGSIYSRIENDNPAENWSLGVAVTGGVFATVGLLAVAFQ
jgi:uncharacterized membrane protein HdeD (DUF308 family)